MNSIWIVESCLVVKLIMASPLLATLRNIEEPSLLAAAFVAMLDPSVFLRSATATKTAATMKTRRIVDVYASSHGNDTG